MAKTNSSKKGGNQQKRKSNFPFLSNHARRLFDKKDEAAGLLLKVLALEVSSSDKIEGLDKLSGPDGWDRNNAVTESLQKLCLQIDVATKVAIEEWAEIDGSVFESLSIKKDEKDSK
jgi:hypothetical protein